MRQDAVGDVLRLNRRSVHRPPVLLSLPVQQGIIDAGLQAEMDRQQERESSAGAYAVKVHLREGETVRPLLVLRVTHLNAVFHTKLVTLLLFHFLGRIEERIIRYLVRRFIGVVRPDKNRTQTCQ